LILGLLAAEITARTGRDPAAHYAALSAELGAPFYARIDAPISREQKAAFAKLTPDAVRSRDLAGDPITARLTRAPGNGAPIGGLKVCTANGWFAARPSGTENLYKLYAESFRSEEHLGALLEAAKELVSQALGA
jgi:phosphoglucomutase